MNLDKILEITFVSIVLYLVLKNASGFTNSVGALSDAYVSGVKALQGRGN